MGLTAFARKALETFLFQGREPDRCVKRDGNGLALKFDAICFSQEGHELTATLIHEGKAVVTYRDTGVAARGDVLRISGFEATMPVRLE